MRAKIFNDILNFLNLFERETGRFYDYRHDPNDVETLAADTVYAVNVDANGGVWVGTQGGGLDRVVGDARQPDAITFANISERDGLANDVIYGVQVDNSGRVWMSTNHGISRYNPDTGEIKNLHRTDGLQSEEFNFGSAPGLARGQEGGDTDGDDRPQPGRRAGDAGGKSSARSRTHYLRIAPGR